MLTKDREYTHEELEELGLERAREGFGDGYIYLGETHGYVMNRKDSGLRLFFRYDRSQ
jgi:hypothetical protein